MSTDYYQILGVSEDADQDVIKKAYRKLSMKYHPDKNKGDPTAEEKFRKLAMLILFYRIKNLNLLMICNENLVVEEQE